MWIDGQTGRQTNGCSLWTLEIYMNFVQGHDIRLDHGQQLCKILSRSNMAVRSYGTATNFCYVCTVTLTVEVWTWFKVMTHSWVMDNNCVKYFLRSNMAVRSYDPGTDFSYVCTVTLTLEIRPSFCPSVCSHSWVPGHNCLTLLS